MYLISDNIDTLTGMRLAGVEGVIVHEHDELKEALERTIADKEIGIILLTEKFIIKHLSSLKFLTDMVPAAGPISLLLM